MDHFKTNSSPKKQLRIIAVTFLVMAALVVPVLLVLRLPAATFLFFEGMLALSWFICWLASRKAYFELEFRGDRLELRNVGTRQAYTFTEMRRADFVLRQNAKQRQLNCGDLKIVGTPFGIYDVRDFEGLGAYLDSHYS